MITHIPFTQTRTKNNGSTCTISEYIFNQPSVDLAKAVITGRYPAAQNKKAINLVCDLIYFVLEGQCTLNTVQGSFTLNVQDALFIPHGNWYWVETNHTKILIISTPTWNAEQYREV